MKLMDQFNLASQTVFVRCEFNVALDEDAEVMDFTRLKASLPTLEYLRSNKSRIVICSHIGRPWGKRDPSKSLSQLVEPLSNLMNTKIAFADDCIGAARNTAQNALRDGDVLLLENVRYHTAENENSMEFGKQLVEGIDIYVNDAFGNCHRSHASMVAAALQAPAKCAGRLLERELKELSLTEESSFRPSVAIIGGAKVSGKDGKIRVIDRLVEKLDTVVVVGKIAYYFLASQGLGVGRTLTSDTRGIDSPGASENEDFAACIKVLEKAKALGCQIVLPVDSAAPVADSIAYYGHGQGEFPAEARALDIGPATLARIAAILSKAGLVVWNGPTGYFEKPEFKHGTLEVARMMNTTPGHVIVGGGDTITAIASIMEDRPGHIHLCTGGGAMLTYLAGETLPAVAALG